MKKTIKYRETGTEPPARCQNSKKPDDLYDSGSEEAILISRCRSGNMTAMSQLIEKYQNRLFNAVFRMVGNHDDALELTQEAFYRAIKSIKKFRGEAHFYSWLYRIGMNLCINHHRRGKRVRITSLHSDSGATGSQADGLAAMMAGREDDSPVYQVQVKENYARALLALEKLDGQARAVVVLRDIENLNYSQIAGILQVPVGTVKSRLSRARMAIRELLLESKEKETNIT